MNILYLPHNLASLPSITAAEINKIDNFNARNLVLGLNKYQSVNNVTIKLPDLTSIRKNPVKGIYSRWNFKKQLKKWIAWADVLHYLWGPVYEDGRDVEWARKAKKKIFIEWGGSDIRDPLFLSTINPFFKKVFENGYEYFDLEMSDFKNKVQQIFAEAGATVIDTPEMSLYIKKDLFPRRIRILQRMNLEEFLPSYPLSTKKRPLIVHSPSAKIAKGSFVINDVINELKEEYDFDFVMLHDMKREDVLEKMYSADIFIDQIIIGGYGMATIEALAFGKPVICYLLPQLFEAGLPEDCPIVNANPANFKEQLINLITNGQLRHDLGIAGRQYVEKNHEAKKLALQLTQAYLSAFTKEIDV